MEVRELNKVAHASMSKDCAKSLLDQSTMELETSSTRIPVAEESMIHKELVGGGGEGRGGGGERSSVNPHCVGLSHAGLRQLRKILKYTQACTI